MKKGIGEEDQRGLDKNTVLQNSETEKTLETQMKVVFNLDGWGILKLGQVCKWAGLTCPGPCPNKTLRPKRAQPIQPTKMIKSHWGWATMAMNCVGTIIFLKSQFTCTLSRSQLSLQSYLFFGFFFVKELNHTQSSHQVEFLLDFGYNQSDRGPNFSQN